MPKPSRAGRKIFGRGTLTKSSWLAWGLQSRRRGNCRGVDAAADGLSIRVLDSTHPDAINSVLAGRAWSRILFIFASKSGSTIEVESLCTWVMDNLEEQGVAEPGAQCIAITDPGSALADLAVQRRFLDCLENPADIGGRFSALSAFGMAPCRSHGGFPSSR